MSDTIQIYRNSGWIGYGERPTRTTPCNHSGPILAPVGLDSRPKTGPATNAEEAWDNDRSAPLMPASVRTALREEAAREREQDRVLPEREYAEGGKTDVDNNILLPPGVRRRDE